MTLEELRSEIDRLDGEIVLLLNERACVARKIGEEKKKDGIPVRDGDRERKVMEHIKSLNCGPLSDRDVENVYHRIMDSCSDLQAASE